MDVNNEMIAMMLLIIRTSTSFSAANIVHKRLESILRLC